MGHQRPPSLYAMRSGSQPSMLPQGGNGKWQAPTRAALEQLSDAGSIRPFSPGTVSVGSTIREFLNDESSWARSGRSAGEQTPIAIGKGTPPARSGANGQRS